jgi:hypothetical protein
LTASTACENIPLTCDIPFTGAIEDSVDTDLLSFTVPTNEKVSILILTDAPSGTNFQPYWRLLDSAGKPASSCGSFVLAMPFAIECGPLSPSGNPYRIELTDFFNDDKGTYIVRLLWRTSIGLCPPSQPILTTPANGAINVPINPTAFSWLTANRATSYRLQVAYDSSFVNLAFNQPGIIGTSFAVNGLKNDTPYYWHVNASNMGGTSLWSNTWGFRTIFSVAVNEKKENETPTEFSLSQNYPNPFNPSTTIAFSLPRAENVMLKIFDLVGREIVTLVDEKLAAGRYEAHWDASGVESGNFFYQLRAGEFVATKKLVLMK